MPPHFNPEFLKYFVYTIYLNHASKNSQETAVEPASQKKHLASTLGTQAGAFRSTRTCPSLHHQAAEPYPSCIREGTGKVCTGIIPHTTLNRSESQSHHSLINCAVCVFLMQAAIASLTVFLGFLYFVSLEEKRFSLCPQKSPRQHYITLRDQELHGRWTPDFNSQQILAKIRCAFLNATWVALFLPRKTAAKPVRLQQPCAAED